MALISCPECSKEISDKATSCPNCGAPISNNNTNEKPINESKTVTRSGGVWEGIGFLLIVGGMIYGMATGPDNHIGGTVAFVGIIIFIIGRFK